MSKFPDESSMDRSQDGTEVIRGGSIGLNRILGNFVKSANDDRKPQFNAYMLSAFTIFRNIWATLPNPTKPDIEKAFVKDVNLFLEYYDTYLSCTVNDGSRNKHAPVIVYFPTYKHLQKDAMREHTGKQKELFDAYDIFYKTHGNDEGQVRKLDHVICYWIKAGDQVYPHKELARKFKDIATHPSSLYSSGDPVGLLTHIPLDLFVASRIRNVSLIESYTGKIKPSTEFKFKIDKDGRLPFQPSALVVFGDDILIKPMVMHKKRKDLLEEAERDKWVSRSEDDIRSKLVKALNIPSRSLSKFDFL